MKRLSLQKSFTKECYRFVEKRIKKESDSCLISLAGCCDRLLNEVYNFLFQKRDKGRITQRPFMERIFIFHQQNTKGFFHVIRRTDNTKLHLPW